MKIIDRHVWRGALVRLGLSIAMGLALAGIHSAPASAATTAATAAITYTVVSTVDASGSCPGSTCTLRAAITAANGDADDSVILFDSSLGGSTITLASALPVISTPITIQGPAGNISISGDNLYQVFNVDPAGTLTLQGLTITRGNATNGGGVYNNGRLVLVDTLFSSNSADDGGGVYNDRNGRLTITDSMFINNLARRDGGGVYNDTANASTLTGSTFNSNSAARDGGAIRGSGGMLTIGNSAFDGNTARDGGAIRMSSNLNLSQSAFTSNIAWDGGVLGTGGGVLFDNINASYNLTNVTFAGNQARGTAGDGGGAIMVNGGNLTLIHATVTNNSTASTNRTFGMGGGGIGVVDGLFINLRNTIVAGNASGVDKADLSGNYQSSGYNMVGSTYGNSGITDGANNDMAGTKDAPINPMLGPLSYYGGSTKTAPLLPGSPALDRIPNDGTNGCGSTITIDQRGIARAQNGACDIGAVESHGFTLAKALGDNQSTTAGYGFANPLGVHVASAFNEPVTGGRVSFVAPDTGASAILTTVAGITVSASLPSSPVITATIDASGDASAIPLANDVVGAYQVTASAAGSAPVSFSLSNLEHSTTAVEFTYFDAAPLRGRDVQLAWATSPGVNCESFKLYRSEGSVLGNAELAQSIAAHAPGDAAEDYAVVDHTPAPSAWWYWLKCVLPGGATTEALMTGSSVQTFDFTINLPAVFKP